LPSVVAFAAKALAAPSPVHCSSTSAPARGMRTYV
jgi:hypothetical protein